MKANRFMRFFGITAGDEDAIRRHGNAFAYLWSAGYKSFLRLLANHCILPSLRVSLFRWSGVRIGKGTQINMNVTFLDDFVAGRIALEEDVSVAPGVSFVSDSHPNNSPLYRDYRLKKSGRILVKRGAWIGVGAVILPGVTIGMASVIGANAVVTREVEDYAVMAGIPARKISDVRKPGGEAK
jgi:acetyltransferase-like isoleucine patch superfamily enzyme